MSEFFTGHRSTERPFTKGPIQALIPGFHVLEVHPGPRSSCWTYVSVGAGRIQKPRCPPMEFVLAASSSSERQVELLAMAAHYHEGETLALEHTFPLGEPWLPGCSLDHLLVSLPYPFGPELELFEFDGSNVHLYWLLPITKAERDLKVRAGIEVLEARFDAGAIHYWDPLRPAVA